MNSSFSIPRPRSFINVRSREIPDIRIGIKSCSREDPDVIYIGEMRDLETIQPAITAAETGHLVLGTPHTSSAAKTVERIVDVFPGDQQEQARFKSNFIAWGDDTNTVHKGKRSLAYER